MSQTPLDSTAAQPAEPVESRETVVCPECGTQGGVTLNRREATDFCTGCDFPLFWTPSVVLRDQNAGAGENLRRLPGTGGRQTVAATPCPTCAEANPISAVNCLRCGGPMVLPFVAVPEPVKVVAQQPAPVPVAEPMKPFPWWWVAAGVTTLLALVLVLIVLLGN